MAKTNNRTPHEKLGTPKANPDEYYFVDLRTCRLYPNNEIYTDAAKKLLLQQAMSHDSNRVPLEGVVQLLSKGCGGFADLCIRKKDNKAVGLFVYTPSISAKGRILHLEDIITDKESRGMGVGSLMMAHFLSLAEQGEYQGVRFATKENNKNAIGLFKKFSTTFGSLPSILTLSASQNNIVATSGQRHEVKRLGEEDILSANRILSDFRWNDRATLKALISRNNLESDDFWFSEKSHISLASINDSGVVSGLFFGFRSLSTFKGVDTSQGVFLISKDGAQNNDTKSSTFSTNETVALQSLAEAALIEQKLNSWHGSLIAYTNDYDKDRQSQINNGLKALGAVALSYGDIPMIAGSICRVAIEKVLRELRKNKWFTEAGNEIFRYTRSDTILEKRTPVRQSNVGTMPVLIGSGRCLASHAPS